MHPNPPSLQKVWLAGLCFGLLAAGAPLWGDGGAMADPQASAEAPAASAPAAESPKKEGGVMVQMPQSPALTPVKIGYIRESADQPRPSSRMDLEPANAGVAGAELAIGENNAGGKSMGDVYSLDVKTVTPKKAVEALEGLYDSGHNYIIVDASADTLLKLSDWAKGKDILLFNIRATDVSLRQQDCRANVMHVVPDRYMLADALAQYLVIKKWTNWLLVHGSTPGDLAYTDAIKRAAGRFGATIVDNREYKDLSGGRRDDIGMIPPASRRAPTPRSPPIPITRSSSSPMRISCSVPSCLTEAAASPVRWRAPRVSWPPPGAQGTRSGAPPR